MARVYDRTMFHGATYADLEPKGRPLIAVGATDVSYGAPFLFTQENFDLICANLESFPLARAVAASNGFPGPVLARDADQPYRRLRRTQARLAHRSSRRQSSMIRSRAWAGYAVTADRYPIRSRPSYLHLVDGGVSDNLALRAAGSMMLTSATDIGNTPFLSVRRILIISVDGEGSQDTSVARRKAVGGIFSLLGLVTGNQIDSYNFDTLIVLTEQLQSLQAAIIKARCARGPVFERYPLRRRAGEAAASFARRHAARTREGQAAGHPDRAHHRQGRRGPADRGRARLGDELGRAEGVPGRLSATACGPAHPHDRGAAVGATLARWAVDASPGHVAAGCRLTDHPLSGRGEKR